MKFINSLSYTSGQKIEPFLPLNISGVGLFFENQGVT